MKIYLATPYSSDDKDLEFERYFNVSKKAGELMNQGYTVYSPITHCRPIALVCDLPHNWYYWEKIDTEFIDWCDILYVYMQDGWENSKGVQNEIDIARKLGKNIVYINDEG